MSSAPGRVVVAEDDPSVADVVCRYLTHEGYEALSASDGPAALELCVAEEPDLAVLDVMLPGISGLEVCRRLQAIRPTPVILLTARTEEDDRLEGFDAGADDYVTKPFSPRELMARVRAVRRRSEPTAEQAGPLDIGRIRIDQSRHEVTKDGVPVATTSREFDLLAFLARHPGQPFRREQLLEKVWGYTIGDTSTVTVHIRRLREKLEDDPSDPALISTVWGVGYRLECG